MSKRELSNLCDAKSEKKGKKKAGYIYDRQGTFNHDSRVVGWTGGQWHAYMKLKLDMEKISNRPVTRDEVLAEQPVRQVIHSLVSRAVHKVVKKRAKTREKAAAK